MDIKAVKFRKDGFYSQPFVFGGEEGQEKFDKNIRYRHPSISVRASATIWRLWLHWDTSQSRLQRYC